MASDHPTAASGAATLGPIQRFNLRVGIVNPEANGLYVRYVDHVEHVEAARAAALAAQEAEPAVPVAWQERQRIVGGGWCDWYDIKFAFGMNKGERTEVIDCTEWQWRPLYAHPPRPQAADPSPELQLMTAHRAVFFLERFLREEKLLSPNEQAAVHFAVAALAAAPQAPAAATESVLIDGVAYSVPAAVAGELLRLHLEAMEAPAAGAAPSQHITQPYTVAEIRERVASGDYSAELMLQHALLYLGAGAAPTDAEIEAVADSLFDHLLIGDKLERMDRDEFREVIGSALADYQARWGAAAPAQEAEDGWMPIETAPDGERVLLGPRHAPVVGTVHQPAHWHEEQEPTATVVHYNGTTLVAGYRCSEWHRLPGAPPRAEARRCSMSRMSIGDAVEESPVGPGTITGFSERGFPMVDHITVARLTLADGRVFDPYDTYAEDAARARQEGGAA